MIKTIIENKKLYLLWMILVLMITASVVTSTVLSLAAFAALLVAVIFFAPNDALVLLTALLPFANIFKMGPTQTSLFTVAELVLVVVLILKIKKIRTSFFLAVLALAVYVIITSAENINVLLIVKFLFGFLLIYFALKTLRTDDIKSIAYLWAAGAIVMMVLTLNNAYLAYVLPYYDEVNLLVGSNVGGDVIRASGFFGDPNYCSVFLILTLATLCTLYYHKLVKIEFWFLFVPISVLGFFTYSKSYFLAVCVLILFLLIFVLFPKHKGWAILSIAAMAVILFLILDGRIELVNVMLERFKGGDLTTGRAALNDIYMAYIRENPLVMLFGEGIATDIISGANNNVHNIYIESLVKFGVVGCAAYLLNLKLAIGELSLRGKRVADFLPLLFMLVMYFFLAGITAYDLSFYIIIVFGVLSATYAPVQNIQADDNQLK